MSEPLTDEQMQELEELWLGKIAVANIRELREIGLENTKIRKAMLAENAKLREYVKHKEDCKLTIWNHDNNARRRHGYTVSITPKPCTCGLDAALKGAHHELG